MNKVNINSNFVFTAEARAQISNKEVSFPGLAGTPLFFLPGDFVSFEAFGDEFTFEVLNRCFRLRSQFDLDVTYVLDLPTSMNPDINTAPHLRLVNPGSEPKA